MLNQKCEGVMEWLTTGQLVFKYHTKWWITKMKHIINPFAYFSDSTTQIIKHHFVRSIGIRMKMFIHYLCTLHVNL